jgi:hypothetical protein
MNTLNRLIQGGVMAGFLILSSGCVIAPDGDRGRDRVVREHDSDHYRDHDRRDHDDRHCDDRDEHCRDR